MPGSAKAPWAETKCHEDKPSKAWDILEDVTLSIHTRICISTTQLPGILGLSLINIA